MYNLEDLLEKLHEGIEYLTNEEAKFLNQSFKNELKSLLNKYDCEIGFDIVENKTGENKIILTSEISHYDSEVLISGNFEFNNIKRSDL